MEFDRDRPLTLFSSEGKLSQCDNALVAAVNGQLSVGACADDGAVLISLKQYSPLIDKSKVQKVKKVCDTIGITYSGLQSDFRAVYERCMLIAEDYKHYYGRYPTLSTFINTVALSIQSYTQTSGMRPFGVLLLFIGENSNGKPCLYRMDPSGSYRHVNALAIGKDYANAKRIIESRLESTDDNIISCLNAIKSCVSAPVGVDDVDIGVFKDHKLSIYSRFDVEEVFDSFDPGRRDGHIASC